MTTSNQKWRENNPLGYATHILVNEAVRLGKLIKQPCEICGSKRVHAHHEDYLKPFEITWLCPVHHREHHAIEKGLTVGGKQRTLIPPAWPNRIRYQPAPIRDANLSRTIELRNEGRSYEEIAKIVGVSKGTVYKWLNPKKYT